jgi:hypothetical protein
MIVFKPQRVVVKITHIITLRVQSTTKNSAFMHPTMLPVARSVAAFAVDQLAVVDYTVANRVTEDVASVVHWAYAHDVPFPAQHAVSLLATLDAFGSTLISLVLWLVCHTP